MTRTTDIVIIGAGVIGCAIAWELARRRASVLVVDPRGVGLGATQASAGVLAPYIEGHETGLLRDLAVRSLGLFDAFVGQATIDSGIPVHYERGGTLEVATSDEAAERLKAAAVRLAASGVRSAFLDARLARQTEPQLSEETLAALLVHDHGFVVASELTKALSGAAVAHNARFIAPKRVRRLVSDARGLRVEMDEGRLTAGKVVLTAGSWSGEIAVDELPALPIRPVRGQLLQLAWPAPPLARVTWGERCYLVPWKDGPLLVGATSEEAGFDERATVAGVRDLLEAACDLVPRAWQAAFAGARVGLRPATPDELPIVGASKTPGLFYATGHYRNGILLAPLTARLVADLLLEGLTDPALDVMRPQRFGDY